MKVNPSPNKHVKYKMHHDNIPFMGTRKVSACDYAKAKITFNEKIKNFFRSIAKIFIKDINVFTTNAKNMQGTIYLRCLFNKNMFLYRGSVLEDNISEFSFKHDTIIEADGLTEEQTEDLAKLQFDEICTNIGNNEVVKIDIPTYPKKLQTKDSLSYTDFIKKYLKTFDSCLKLYEKENIFEQNIFSIKFGFTGTKIKQDNTALNQLNKEALNNINSFISNTNNFIDRQRELGIEGDKEILQSMDPDYTSFYYSDTDLKPPKD